METNPYTCLQLDVKPAAWVKITGGFRYDHFFYDIADNFRGLNVSPDAGFISPRAGISISPVRGWTSSTTTAKASVRRARSQSWVWTQISNPPKMRRLKWGCNTTRPTASGISSATLSAMQRWEGPKPLNTTNSLSTKTYSRVDVRLSYTNAKWRGASTF